MAKYIVKRFFYILIVFLILSFLLFLIYNMLPIDKAAAQAKEDVKTSKNTLSYEEQYKFWSERYGTNGTKLERYGRWIGIYPFADGTFRGMLQGEFGDSNVYGRPVAEIIVEPMKNTIMINIVATILALDKISIKNMGIIHNREFEEGALKIEFYTEEAQEQARTLLKRRNYTVFERE